MCWGGVFRWLLLECNAVCTLNIFSFDNDKCFNLTNDVLQRIQYLDKKYIQALLLLSLSAKSKQPLKETRGVLVHPWTHPCSALDVSQMSPLHNWYLWRVKMVENR